MTVRTEQQWRSDILDATSDGKQLTGRVWQRGKFWLAEIPSLDAMTQGMTEEDAYDMVGDLLETLVNLPAFSVQVRPEGGGRFTVRTIGANPED